MQIYSIIRYCVVLILSLLTLFLLSGCFMESFGSGKNAPSVDSGMVTTSADQVKQAVKELPAEKSAMDKKLPKPFPTAEEQFFTQQLNLKNPEGLMPLALSPSRPQTKLSQAVPPASARREATVRPPDFFYREETLTEDTAWHGEVLIEGGVTIAPQATLTVQSGTVVRFKGGAGAGAHAVLVIQGRIVVNGSADKPVIFRSLYEDAETGDWQGIVLLASGKKNLIENCRVEGAETGFDASFSTVTMKNTFFSKCRSGARLQDCFAVMTGGGAGECGTGVIFYDCEADIRLANFFGNRLGIFAARSSLSLAGSRFTGNNLLALSADTCKRNITGNNFTANGSGLSLIACEGTVSANRIAKNAAFGLVLKQSKVKVNANEIELNIKAGLRVEDGRGIAWGNAFFANGDYDLYNAGTDEFRAIGNWWGDETADVAGRIYDRRMDDNRGRVFYLPVLRTRPEIEIR